jgi:type II secretory pathway component PulK
MRMERSPSIRFFSRASERDQKGFALISALVVAILFFGILELLLMESSEAFRAASRFRSRAVAQTLAENAAELAARNMLAGATNEVRLTTPAGTMLGRYQLLPTGEFRIVAMGSSEGIMPSTASVILLGRFDGSTPRLLRTIHSQ